MTIERVEIQNNSFVQTNSDGHGATGEIKKASWLGKSVEVGGTNLNKGSLIDFLNSKTPPNGEKLKKGFLGLGGDSDEKVQAKFKEMYPSFSSIQTAKKQTEPLDHKKLAALPDGVCENFSFSDEKDIEERGGVCLTKKETLGDAYVGIVFHNNTLVLCPGSGMEFSKKDYDKLVAKAIKKLQELNLTPTSIAVSGSHKGNTLQAFRDWKP